MLTTEQQLFVTLDGNVGQISRCGRNMLYLILLQLSYQIKFIAQEKW